MNDYLIYSVHPQDGEAVLDRPVYVGTIKDAKTHAREVILLGRATKVLILKFFYYKGSKAKFLQSVNSGILNIHVIEKSYLIS